MPFDAHPEWTETSEKRGLDPLGLQGAGIILYQRLLPGISNVTLRMRYYGLYVWLSDTYGHLSGSTDPEEWCRWVRRTEALYALAATAAGGESGVAGVDWANKLLKRTAPEGVIDFRPGTATTGESLYLTNKMGVYGGAYVSQLVEMGFLAKHVQYDLLAPTPDLGLPLAAAFRASIGADLEKCLIDTIQAGVVRRSDLERLREVLPSRIPEGSAEADVYVDALFALNQEATQNAVSRRATLQLIMEVAVLTRRLPTPEDVRWTLFNASPGSLGANLEPERILWEAYQTHDLLQIALAGLLRLAIETLRGSGATLPFSDLVELAADTVISAAPWPAETLWSECVASVDRGDLAQAEKLLTRLRNHAMPTEALEASLVLLAATHARIERRPDLASTVEASFPDISRATYARSLRSELAFLQGRSDQPLADVVRELMADRVIRRHSYVAMTKFARQRDYTFLFDSEESRLRYRATYAPVATTPRLGPAITFLNDLGLLGPDGLTTSGEALRATLS